MPQLSDVSLYIPARNAATTLGACLEHVLRLDPAPRRILVVVDVQSRDDTAQVARRHGRVEVVEQARAGLTGARNQAFDILETEWVASLDADVLPAQDWLGKLADARQHFPHAVGIAGRTEERIRGVGDLWRALMHPHHWGAHALDGPFMIVSDALFQRKAVKDVGGYRESLVRYGDDSRLSRDLRDAGYGLAYVPEARALHVRHDDWLPALDLRWSYSEPRQAALLQDLTGLAQKLEHNLAYGRMALARGTYADAQPLAWMGAVLPLHHALRDVEAMLRARPCILEAMRRQARDDVWRCLYDAASPYLGMQPALLRMGEPSAGPAPIPWPRWNEFLATLAHSTKEWLAEVATHAPVLGNASPPTCDAPDARADVARWAEAYGGPDGAAGPWIPARPVSPWPQDRDYGVPAGPTVWRADSLPSGLAKRSVTVVHPGPVQAGPVQAGPVIPRIHHLIPDLSTSPRGPIDVLYVPALGSCPRPRALLHRWLPLARTAVVVYRPPASLSGGEFLMAADLAEACAAAGLRITSFETKVGDAHLTAVRGADDDSNPGPAR